MTNQSTGCALTTIASLALLLLLASVALAIVMVDRQPSAVAQLARPVSTRGELLFGDVDQDAHEDVVVWSVNERGQRLVAVSGLDGHVLWERDVFYPTEGVFLADRLLVVATQEPTLDVFRLDDGAPLGAIPLTRRVQRLCGEGPGSLRAEEQGGSHELVDLRTGVVTGVSPGECRSPLPWTDRYVRALGIRGPYRSTESAGSGRERTFVPDEPSAPRLALARGGRSTAPILLARAPDDHPLWQAPITTLDPSLLRREDPALGTDGTVVVAIYRVGRDHRATAFAIGDGTRLWDVGLGTLFRASSVVVRSGRVYFGPTPVHVHDLRTGRRLFVLGVGPS